MKYADRPMYKFVPKVACPMPVSLVCSIGPGMGHTEPDKRGPSDFPALRTIYERNA